MKNLTIKLNKLQLALSIILCSLIIFSSETKAQTNEEAGPKTVYPGCPKAALAPWTACEDPEFDLPELVMTDNNTSICYDCSTGICELMADWNCNNPCTEVTTFEMIFDPKNNNYLTVYKVRKHNPMGGDDGIYFCYKVYSVPIYELNSDGTYKLNSDGTRKVLGMKFIWRIIPNVIGINPEKQLIYN